MVPVLEKYKGVLKIILKKVLIVICKKTCAGNPKNVRMESIFHKKKYQKCEWKSSLSMNMQLKWL